MRGTALLVFDGTGSLPVLDRSLLSSGCQGLAMNALMGVVDHHHSHLKYGARI